jgi:3-hydroxybutyryl-CoA dehydrogenase
MAERSGDGSRGGRAREDAASAVSAVIGVVGAGTMGAGIAQVALLAGHQVLLYDAVSGAAERGAAGVRARLDRAVERGRLTAGERAAIESRFSIAGDLAAFAPAALVVEAIVEDAAVKRELFARLEDVVTDDAILASNTSSISVTALGAGLRHPERVVGMHFFNPAPVMRLVEIISGLTTAPEVAERAAELAHAWGKTPVRCASTPGFIVNRVARPFYGEALRLVEERAATPATIDAALRESGGFPMGPFELMDLIGVDVNLAVSTSVWQATGHDPRYTPAWTQREHVAAGLLGRKSGRGFHRYAKDGGRVEPAPSELPATAARRASPARVWLEIDENTGEPGGDLGPAAGLLPLLRQAGVEIVRGTANAAATGDTLRLPSGVPLCLTNGATATSAGDGRVLFDLVHDWEHARRVVIAPAADAPAEAVREATGLFQACGKLVSVVEDVAGLLVAGTVARLINEAADVVYRGEASEADVDTAMRLGANYPIGPMEWGARVGARWTLTVLRNLDGAYPTGRYRPSPLLVRWAESERAYRRLGAFKRLAVEVLEENDTGVAESDGD